MHAWARLHQLASPFGLTTSTMAGQAGLATATFHGRRRREGWVELHRGVWALPGATLDRRAWLASAVLSAGSDAVLSHFSALEVLGLGDQRGQRHVEVVVPMQRQVRRRPHLTVHHTRWYDPDAVVTSQGLPSMPAARTLVDCAARLGGQAVLGHLLQARQRGLLTHDDIRRELSLRPTLAGVGRVRRALALAEGDASESILEHLVVQLLEGHGIRPLAQYKLRCADGRRVRLDLALPEHRLAIECDGRAYHSLHRAFEGDRARSRSIQSTGWHVLPVTWRMLHEEPDAIVAAVRRLMAQG